MNSVRRSELADDTVGRLIVRSVRRNFHALFVAGAANLHRLDPTRPIVACVNHTNWWDGFVLYAFARARLPDWEFHLAMDEKQLGGYFFFRWLGAFGMGLDGAADAVNGVRYAVRLLNRKPGRIAWIFVQGALTTPLMPIVARPGAVFISRHANAPLLPVVLRYEWRNESKPTILLSVGEPLPPETESGVLAARMNILFANLDSAVADPLRAGLEPVNPPRLSLNKRWDYLRFLAMGGRGTFERENR